jgi:hypothetical protein
MKRLGMLALAALLVVAFTVPASAIEVEFGGYWRTRFLTQQNFSGEDETERLDQSLVDTRTRLYMNTIFHKNLRFVNQFEFDAVWGSPEGSRASMAVDENGKRANRGYGEVGGADGANIEIKRSYVDFDLGPVNAKIGVQGFYLGREFLISPGNDSSGAIVSFKGGNFEVPFMWLKANEGGRGRDAGDLDADVYAIAPSFSAGGVKINPYLMHLYSKDISRGDSSFVGREYEMGQDPSLAIYDEVKIFYAGADIDFNIDPVSFWLTGIYQFGDADRRIGNVSDDFEAWLAAAGFSVGFGFGDIHGRAFYATGDDGSDATKIEQFFVPGYLPSYYWSEIMGLGIFDWQVSRNSPGDQIGDILAANLGVTIKPMPKLSFTFDAWYAQLAEDIVVSGKDENYLGTELNLKITYQLVQNLNLDIVGAYLFAGEATTLDSPNDADPYEVGARLSLSF